jgi:integrase
MAKHLLSAIAVKNAAEGDLNDGEGLVLRVKSTGASWVLRYTAASGRRRELGLGAADRASIEAAGTSLKRARKKAGDARDLLDKGTDPIDARRAHREAERSKAEEAKGAKKAAATTVLRYARAYHEKHVEPVRSDKHGKQWIASIEQHVPKALLDSPIDTITAVDLLDAMVPVLRKLPETGSRVYQRLSTIFDAAVIDALRPDNPATPIRRELRKRAGRRERGSFAAMPYRQIPDFVEKLRKVEGNSARCLEFTILTAARTSEALTAEWCEFDLDTRTWTIPGAKMKCREQHVVYLSDRLLQILKAQEGQHVRFVFPSPREAPMSNMAMMMLLRRHATGATTHGFRASFRAVVRVC